MNEVTITKGMEAIKKTGAYKNIIKELACLAETLRSEQQQPPEMLDMDIRDVVALVLLAEYIYERKEQAKDSPKH